MKKYLPHILCIFLVTFTQIANAQVKHKKPAGSTRDVAHKPLILDTAPLGGAETVILPTYDNLVKLCMLDSISFATAMKQFGYSPMLKLRGRFIADKTDDYFVNWDKYSVEIYFNVNTTYPQALEADIKKRFPRAEQKTVNTTECYTITMNGAAGRSVQYVNIEKTGAGDNDEGGGGSLMVVN